MTDAFEGPARVGLCPTPEHYGEFYVPLGDGSAVCPDCDRPLIVYTRDRPSETEAYAPLPLEEESEGDWFGVALAAFFVAIGVCAILYSLARWGVL